MPTSKTATQAHLEALINRLPKVQHNTRHQRSHHVTLSQPDGKATLPKQQIHLCVYCLSWRQPGVPHTCDSERDAAL